MDVADPGEADVAELAGVNDDDRPFGLLHHHPVDGRLGFVVRGHPGDRIQPTGAEEAQVGGQLAQRLRRHRPDQLITLWSRDAAADDDLDEWADGELGGDVQRVGDHGDAVVQRPRGRNRSGNLDRGRAAVQ